MWAQSALFESVALVITSSAQLSSVNFANALAGNATIQTLLLSFFNRGELKWWQKFSSGDRV
jgi:hypothetical protein